MIKKKKKEPQCKNCKDTGYLTMDYPVGGCRCFYCDFLPKKKSNKQLTMLG